MTGYLDTGEKNMNIGSGGSNKQMTLGFDAKRALFNTSGLGNYSRNLLNALEENYPDNDYLLFTPRSENRIHLAHDDKFRIIGPGNSFFRLFSSLWRTKFISSDIKKEKPDLYHGLSHELPFGIEKSGVKTVLTVHDLIFIRHPELYKWLDRTIYTRKLVHSCKVADKIVAISEQTRRDLVEILRLPEDKITVIYQGCNPIFRKIPVPDEIERIRLKYALPDKYLLFVGTIEERKNLLGVIKGMHEAGIEMPLVAVGRKRKDYFEKIDAYISSEGIRNVMFLEGIINTDLPVIYRNAECFVYPSFVEGFGIPLVEAAVSGTPVITTEGGCFPEAAGPGSVYVDPHNTSAIGNAIRMVLEDTALREKMIRTGLEFTERFRDEIIAKDYMNLYKSI
jgi:glycosyltransferase involved in cell wall biosynthesis